jgi:hypothetical protein
MDWTDAAGLSWAPASAGMQDNVSANAASFQRSETVKRALLISVGDPGGVRGGVRLRTRFL